MFPRHISKSLTRVWKEERMAGGNQDFMCECVPDRVLPGPLSGLGQSQRIYFTEAEAEAQEYRRLAQGHVIFMLRMCVCFHAENEIQLDLLFLAIVTLDSTGRLQSSGSLVCDNYKCESMKCCFAFYFLIWSSLSVPTSGSQSPFPGLIVPSTLQD